MRYIISKYEPDSFIGLGTPFKSKVEGHIVFDYSAFNASGNHEKLKGMKPIILRDVPRSNFQNFFSIDFWRVRNICDEQLYVMLMTDNWYSKNIGVASSYFVSGIKNSGSFLIHVDGINITLDKIYNLLDSVRFRDVGMLAIEVEPTGEIKRI